MRIAVIQFPGSNCDQDCLYVGEHILKTPTYLVWHKETSLQDADLVILPGGFSYGDYLRCGAIARSAPIMKAIEEHIQKERFVLGICNGFQILCEARILPGALVRNASRHFRCEEVYLRVENTQNPFLCLAAKNQILKLPIAHGEGCYIDHKTNLRQSLRHNQIALRYCDSGGVPTPASNPNGSIENIAGLLNRKGNVLGLMPHPERACEEILGNTDGLLIFQSLLHWHKKKRSMAASS
ncbi:MAG: phosphoribosylformylglycinamidine synthase subunit PurQ [Methylacidiphilales bacterium]|nr:phosphoribosylformylglycinamidine synthase subunit PurQ [Candidatus Methylacidiphilales bacterium]MDW8348863.1 phosphoribosylformylglycinamidine synthase subunit PurQ [Verrucomicrobiae bacterium]